MTEVRAVAVGIPARDEQENIASCVEATIGAIRRTSLPAALVIVADRCSDETASLAASLLSEARDVASAVVSTDAGRVGVARQAACTAAIDLLGSSIDPRACWLATTDADSVVPEHWLTRQLAWADAGYDGVAGLVDLDPGSVTEEFDRLYRRSLVEQGDGFGHGHVHGASLGMRASTFLSAGGFDDGRVGEDHRLWHRARSCGGRLVGVADCTVVTSPRLIGRTPGGLAGYLARLATPAG